jgi:hypothetical protein
MALMLQDPLGSESSSTRRTRLGPDYQVEADRGRLQLRGDQLLARGKNRVSSATLAEELLVSCRAGDSAASETVFELESRGGHARTVTGTVAYFDDEADTFMVRAPSGELKRVPFREIVSCRPGHAGRPGTATHPMKPPQGQSFGGLHGQR